MEAIQPKTKKQTESLTEVNSFGFLGFLVFFVFLIFASKSSVFIKHQNFPWVFLVFPVSVLKHQKGSRKILVYSWQTKKTQGKFLVFDEKTKNSRESLVFDEKHTFTCKNQENPKTQKNSRKTRKPKLLTSVKDSVCFFLFLFLQFGFLRNNGNTKKT